MQCQFPLCTIAVRKARPADLESTADSSGPAGFAENSFAYDLVVAQVRRCRARQSCLSMLVLNAAPGTCSMRCCKTRQNCLSMLVLNAASGIYPRDHSF